MKHSKLSIGILLAALATPILWSAPSIAGHHKEWKQKKQFHKRHKRQKRRIRQGARSGELTRHEARTLRRDQRRYQRFKRRALSDGHISKREWRKGNRILNRNDRRIRRFKHNYRRKYGHNHHTYHLFSDPCEYETYTWAEPNGPRVRFEVSI